MIFQNDSLVVHERNKRNIRHENAVIVIKVEDLGLRIKRSDEAVLVIDLHRARRENIEGLVKGLGSPGRGLGPIDGNEEMNQFILDLEAVDDTIEFKRRIISKAEVFKSKEVFVDGVLRELGNIEKVAVLFLEDDLRFNVILGRKLLVKNFRLFAGANGGGFGFHGDWRFGCFG